MSAHELVKILFERRLTIGLAESLTAGLLTSKLAEIDGVSEVLKGGVVAYQNEIKSGLLGVSQKTLDEFGAVSEQTALEMAAGVAQKLKAKVGISTTGVAGPKTAEGKPVGSVFIGLWVAGQFWSEAYQLSGTRQQIRELTCQNALEFAQKKLLEV